MVVGSHINIFKVGRVALLQTSKLAVADPQQANNF
jgi:hypothetical protein